MYIYSTTGKQGSVMAKASIPGERPVIIIPPSPRMKAQRPRRFHYRGPRPFTIVLALLALIALVHLLIVAHTPGTGQPQAAPAPTSCDGLLRSADYTQRVHFQPASENIAAVEMVNALDGGLPAALVQVTHSDTQRTLDVYVFGCAVQQRTPQLLTLFSQQGLAQGSVTVSKARTLLIGSLDSTLTPGASAFLQPLQQNVYREYAWQNGKFLQVAFPGLYPVTSRAEAEALQQQADSGLAVPWSDPLVTAEQLSRDIFGWPTINVNDRALSNDGVTAQVLLVQDKPRLAVYVTLKRLERQDSKGLWFVVEAATRGITLGLNEQDRTSAPQGIPLQTPLSSPFRVSGTSILTDGQNTWTLIDHTLTPVAQASNMPLPVNGDGTYAATIAYQGIAPGQQGLLLIQSLPVAKNTTIESGQLALVGVVLE